MAKTSNHATRTETLERLHKELSGNYRQKWDAATDDLCERILKELYDEIGQQRLTRTVHRCINESEFFTVAALRRFIPEAARPVWLPTDEERKAAEEARKSPEAQQFFDLLRKLGVKRVDIA